jgi:choline dehydrogenase-like flavoprotein
MATTSSSSDSFDYVIVGGGAAGLVLAARLTEDPQIHVLVLEAGEDLTADPRVNVPAMWVQLAGSEADWRFKTSPQKALAGREMEFPQGRLLGGSSALNTMLFVVSSKSNIDMWAELGNQGWDWASLSKSLEKVYSLHSTSSPSSGKGTGTIQASIPEEDSKWPQVWRNTIASLGFPAENEPLSDSVYGAISYPESIDPKSKTRSYSVSAYLGPAKSRPNLTVWTSALVEKVLFSSSGAEDGQPAATGVQYTSVKDGQTLTGQKVVARKEVILSAGAINSPRILELSGVGDAARLESLGIPVVVDNPFVGENLQNHTVIPLSFETATGAGEGLETIDALSRQDPAALGAAMEAYGRQAGPFSRSNSNVQAQMPFPNISTEAGKRDLEQVLSSALQATAGEGSSAMSPKVKPDYEAAMKSYVKSVLESPTKSSAVYMAVPGWASYNPDGSWAPIPAGNETYFSIPVLLNHPLSRGSVHVTKSSASLSGTKTSTTGPAELGLEIDPNYMSHPLDVEILARHVQFVESVVAATAGPLATCLKQTSDAKRSPALPAGPAAFAGEKGLERARAYVRDTTVGAFHWTSSCSMLPREKGGVVDSQLRVYGCRNLRVCDASIFPLVTSANTMATVYAVAEKGAEIIKAGQ